MSERQQITIEILERNGFKFEDGLFKWFHAYNESFYMGYESVYIDLTDGYMNVTRESPDDGKTKQVRGESFGYVDELQTALTLCGIDKTIQ